MYRNFIAVVGLSAFCIAALAMPRPSDVASAEARGDYAAAESMLKEVIREKPTSARAHDDLGALYSKQGKTDLANLEFQTATKLTADAKSAEDAKKAAEAKASAEFLEVIFGGLGVLLACWLAYYFYSRYRENRAEIEAHQESIRQKTSDLLGLSKQLEDALLINKTASHPDAEKDQINKRIVALQSQVRNSLADIKDGEEVSEMRIATIESNVNNAVYQANNGLDAEQEDHADAEPLWGAPSGKPAKRQSKYWGGDSTPRMTPVQRHYGTTPSAPAQVAPVIVNNSGNDMLTGMMIGEMMSDRHETVIVEHDNDSYDRPSRYSSRDDDSYSSSSSSSSDDSYSSRSSSSDSYSSSSYDSGSSSYDSGSSSSSDSY